MRASQDMFLLNLISLRVIELPIDLPNRTIELPNRTDINQNNSRPTQISIRAFSFALREKSRQQKKAHGTSSVTFRDFLFASEERERFLWFGGVDFHTVNVALFSDFFHKKVAFITSFAFPRDMQLQKLLARTGQQNYEVHFVYA